MSAGPELFFLFRSFFKIGLTSFGGHAALVSVLQKELVQRKRVITEETILDGLSIASFLPGPLAVNVVTFVGYKLRGWPGAFVCMFAVLIPPFFLMILLAFLYNRYAKLDVVNYFLEGVIAVIIAIILTVCYNMFIRHVKNTWQYFLFGITLIVSFYSNSYLWIVLYIVIGALVGYIFSRSTVQRTHKPLGNIERKNKLSLGLGLFAVSLVFILLFFLLSGIHHQLLFEFAKTSLTLFGGGYVMIPILHEIVVDNFKWISSEEFATAIAFGQMTPGPILVSATYIGFKMAGMTGALLATIGIFVPSALLMVLVGNAFEQIKDHPIMHGVIMGIRPVIIALISYSSWVLFETSQQWIFTGLILTFSFLLMTFRKINYFILILIAGILAVLIFSWV